MAIWGIDGGVAKAKLAIMPMIQIVASKFNEEKVEVKIVLATVATKVAVTIFEERLVCTAAHKAKIIKRTKAGKETSELPKVDWR